MHIDLINRKGLQVPETTSGAGGEAIKDNFLDLAEWNPRSVWDADRDPTANDDGREDDGQGTKLNFGVGSQWLNTTTNTLFICRDSEIGAAKWQKVPYLLNNATTGVNAPPKLSGDIDANGHSITNLNQLVANSFSGNGDQLTTLNAANITAGTLADAHLSGNVALRNENNEYSAVQDFYTHANFFGNVGLGLDSRLRILGGQVQQWLVPIIMVDDEENALFSVNRNGAVTAPTFTGSGAALTNLDAANITTGTLAAGRFDDTSHGNRGGASLHAAATTASAGFMSAADKTKLDAASATAGPNTIVMRDGAAGINVSGVNATGMIFAGELAVASFAFNVDPDGNASATSITILNGQFRPKAATLTDGTTINWNLNTGNTATVTLADNRTLANPTNQHNGARYTLIVKQDVTGTRTLTFGTAYKFPGGVSPVLSSAASAVDIMEFLSDGTNMMLVNFIGDVK